MSRISIRTRSPKLMKGVDGLPSRRVSTVRASAKQEAPSDVSSLATVPSAFRAKLPKAPAATAVTPDRPATATGVMRVMFVPSPSCPYPFQPHVQTVPSAFSATVW